MTTGMSNDGFPDQERNKLIIYIGIMMLLNVLIATSIEPVDARRFDGSHVSVREYRAAALKTLLLTSVLIGAVAGALVACLPYRGLAYKQKYMRSFLLATLTIHVLVFAYSSFGLLMR